MVSCFGFDRQGIFLYRNELRESSDRSVIGPRIDLIARLESPHSGSTRTTTPAKSLPKER